MNMDTRYVCTGGCGGWVTEQEFKAGKTTCGTQGCAHFGESFVKKLHCQSCDAYVDEGAPHDHPSQER